MDLIPLLQAIGAPAALIVAVVVLKGSVDRSVSELKGSTEREIAKFRLEVTREQGALGERIALLEGAITRLTNVLDRRKKD